MRTGVILISTAMACGACSAAPVSMISCEIGSGVSQQCTEYSGFSASYPVGPWQTACRAAGGTLGSACPQAASTPSCRVSYGQYVSTIYYYGVPASTVQSTCSTARGTYSGPAGGGDGGTNPTPRPDAGPEASTQTRDYGRCGASVFSECVCFSSTPLDIANCILASSRASMTCQQYLLRAVQACCPTELQAETDCETAATTPPSGGGAAPCAETDDACVTARCRTTNQALARCIASGTQTSACTAAWDTAIGTADPTSDPNC